jgi:hypothetical protein
MMKPMARVALIVASILLLGTGCEATDPYVYRSDEFDRDSPKFNEKPVDRTGVVICYSNLISSAEAVTAVAAEECGRYGKQANRSFTSAGDCPMAVPLEAHFDCVAP